MLAVVPYDWQAHDTYFVVAHLHYVLIGGMVFPVFAAIYYWAPLISGKRLSERMGTWACAMMFIGVNLAFFPDAHLRAARHAATRVDVCGRATGWRCFNLLSTIGAFVFAIGMLHRADRFAAAFPSRWQSRHESVERGLARLAADGQLRDSQHSVHHQSRAVVGQPEPARRSRRRSALSCRAPQRAGARRSSRARSMRTRNICCDCLDRVGGLCSLVSAPQCSSSRSR